jgi:hypothetical protein
LEKEDIPVLEHVGISPDMNTIGGAWTPIRIEITQDWVGPYTIEWELGGVLGTISLRAGFVC